jgi:RNA-directed DNA polymerase
MTYHEFQIPKKSGGFRKITAPDPELLKYQRRLLPQIESLWKDTAIGYEVDEIQHGFVKNRNCVTAAREHIGYSATISMDIADFFDNVTQDHIRVFSPLFGDDQHLYHAEGYCSQGFATSPILCNLALIPAIADIKSILDTEFEGDYAFTIYADDVTISANIARDDYAMQRSIETTVASVLHTHGFAIKPTKTRWRFAQHGFRRVLGVMVGDDSLKVPRKVKYKLRAAKHQKNGPSIGGLTTWSTLPIPRNYE